MFANRLIPFKDYLSFQLRRVFGKGMPSFPPKFYLAMTKSMADERRTQLEQYLQNGIPNATLATDF